MINSDELGEKGESRFKEICADVSLNCNKSDRDRTGWDFIVEFPFDDHPSVSLDNRKTPLSCHIQHKTIFTTSNSISLRLNMAERLAKELKPSFISVFKVNKASNEITEAFLIHIFNNRLGAILKRLREEESKSNNKPINKLNISFTPTASERIKVSGISLRDALKMHCGNDLHLYSKNKQTQLQKLGYEGRPVAATFTLALPDKNKLVDFFLGLSKEVPVSDLETTITRFGISLPEIKQASAKITIQPSSFDTCTIIVRSDHLDAPAIFKGEVFKTPMEIDDEHHLLIKSDLLSIRIKHSKADGGFYNFSFSSQAKSVTPKIWGDYWRFVSAFKNKSGTIEINLTSIPDSIELPIATSSEIVLDDWSPEAAIDICEALSKILKLAGVQPEPLFEFGEIHIAYHAIELLLGIMNGGKPHLILNENVTNIVIPSSRSKSIFASAFQVGNIVIAYYGTAFVDIENADDQSQWNLRDFALVKVRTLIDNQITSLDKFVENAKSAEHIENAYIF